MLYEIEISGGFTGTVQHFKGELELNQQKEKALRSIFNNTVLHKANEDLRDAFVYTFNLKMDNRAYKGIFDDSTIPIELLSLLNEVKVR